MSIPSKDIARILRTEDDFLVAAHVNPDGDAIGAMAAVGFVLQRLGKRFTLYNQSGLPHDFEWLSLPAPIATSIPDCPACWTITLDCGDLHRAGDALMTWVDCTRLINIDHHLGNPGFGSVNWVDTSMASTSQMAAQIARELGFPLEGALGEAVYLGLTTDTGSFSYDNTTARVLELAAEIVRLGLKPGQFNAKLQNQQPLERIQLWSRVLSRTQLLDGGKIALVTITRQDLDATGTGMQDTDGIINTVRRIKGVAVAASLREDGPKEIKFSLRSSGNVNVQPMAASFGGGGHKNAAGGTIFASMSEAENSLVQALRAFAETL